MKQLMLSESWLYRYRFVFGYLILILVGVFALFYQLGTLLPGVNWVESNTAAKSMVIGDLLAHPIDFIYHLLQYISILLLGPNSFAIRLPGVLLAVVTVALFFYIIEHRFSKRAAIITSLLLVFSSWFLNYARLGSTSTLTMMMVLLLIFLTTKLDDNYKQMWLLSLTATAALSLYSPYFAYLLLAGLIFSAPSIRSNFRSINNRDLYFAGSLFAVLIIPLFVAIVRDSSIAKELLGLPEQLPSISGYFGNVSEVIGHVIWRSESLPILHLGTLPMLEIFSVSMVALGLYHYDHELSKNLSRLVLGGLLLTILLLAINTDQFEYALLLPFVYFVLAGGLVILFAQWNEIFPKNPIARVVAIIPIGILLVIVGSYHGERYFVAWPNNPEVVAQHSEAYTNIYEELETNSAYTAVLNSAEEVIVMKPLDLHYGDVMFIDDVAEMSTNSEERRLIITDDAYQALSKDNKEQLGAPSRIVPSAYTSRATSLWIYDVSI